MISIISGGKTGFFTGNMPQLLDDVRALNPTVFVMLPVLANQIYKQFQELVGVYSQSSSYESARERAFREMRKLLGERIMLLTCGTAPTSKEVKKFLSECFNVKIAEGYGTTEWYEVSFA